ncbi:MAG: OmpH family outer membrane protein [Candidatus Glassbacteria bacterium]
MTLRTVTGVMLVSLVLGNSVLAQEIKIGYVDVERIIDSIPGKEEVRKILEEESDVWRRQAEEKMKELQQLRDDYESQKLILSPEKKKSKEEEISQKEKEFNQLWMDLQEKAQKRNAELTQPILEKAEKAINAIAERDNYAIIFDSSVSAIVFGVAELDLTDEVIEEIGRSTVK